MLPVFRTALTIDDLLDEFWHNPTVFFGLVGTLVAAVSVPFAIALSFRAWHHLRKNSEEERVKATNEKIIEKQNEEALKLSGCFNSAIIDTLHSFPLEHDDSEEIPLLRDANEELERISESEDSTTDKNVLSPTEDKQNQKSKLKITEPDEETSRVLKGLSETGLHGKLATAQLRAKTSKIEQSMTDEERKKESEIRRMQLEAIFQMMKDQGDKFGLEDQSDLVEQLKLYSV